MSSQKTATLGKASDLPAAPSASPLQRLKAAAAIRRVNPKDVFKGENVDIDAVFEALLTETNDASIAYQRLFQTFGMALYADKAKLAQEGTAFRILDIVERDGGGYLQDDDWALSIVTEDGESQVLTLEKNEGRDRFIYGLAATMRKFNSPTTLCRLLQIYKKNDTSFYLVVPADQYPAMRNVSAQTIEGEAYEAS